MGNQAPLTMNLNRTFALAAFLIYCCGLFSCSESRGTSSTVQYFGPVPHDADDPYFTFCFHDDSLAWALFIESGFVVEGWSAEIYPEESEKSGWTIRLKSLDRGEEIEVRAGSGAMVFVSADGQQRSVPEAFRLPQNHEDLYSGSFDLTRYPELKGVAELFRAWGKREAESDGEELETDE